MYALLWFLSLIGSIWTFIFSSSALGMLELVCWNFGLGVEQVMKLLPRRSFAFLLIFLALGMYALIFVACYLPILRHWRGVLIYISSMVGETSLLLLKFLVSLLLQAIWMVVEDTKGKLYLPLIMLIAFSIIVIVKVKVFVRHDEMGILEEVAASFLRFMFESIEGKNYVEACLCTFPTMIAIVAVLSPPLDVEKVLRSTQMEQSQIQLTPSKTLCKRGTKQALQQSANVHKASWDSDTVRIFLELVIKELDAGFKGSFHTMTMHGYRAVCKGFQEHTNKVHDVKQLQNKYALIKKDW
ncbi:unnamed protein product [Camellia sinensis]